MRIHSEQKEEGKHLQLRWKKLRAREVVTREGNRQYSLTKSSSPLISMDYLKTVVPSQLVAERGFNLVVINPGSANVRIGLAKHDSPINVPHCIARRTTQLPKLNVQDQMLNLQVTTFQHMEREKAYDVIASLLKIPFLDADVANNSFPRKMGRSDGYNPQSARKDAAFTWTDVYAKDSNSERVSESSMTRTVANESEDQHENSEDILQSLHELKYREIIFGEEAQRISPREPYCLRRPIRRGHLNVSQHYPVQQTSMKEGLAGDSEHKKLAHEHVLEDLQAIWEWLLVEKLHIHPGERNLYSAVLVVPESFDTREIKEMLSILLRDLHFSSAVVHQEGLAAVFGNGLSTGCVVNMGAQVTSVVCVEDGVALPNTVKTLPFGGEDISRCFLWTQRHHQTWPQIRTDVLTKPMDMLMLNRLKESYCGIKDGELEAVGIVHSYEDGMPAGSHKTKLTALNVPPMGLFYPTLLVPDVYPSPPRSWLRDYEDMLDESLHMDFPGMNFGLPMWDNYPVFSTKATKDEKVGLADAIPSRIDLQRKLFCSIQLIGGVALTGGLIPAMEERVLHSIPSTEAIDTVEVLQSRTNPMFVPWKGGAILGVLDFGRDAWVRREEWIHNGICIGTGRKYKDSLFLQAEAMCYINS